MKDTSSNDVLIDTMEPAEKQVKVNPCGKCRNLKLTQCECQAELYAVSEEEAFEEIIQKLLQSNAHAESGARVAQHAITNSSDTAPVNGRDFDRLAVSELLTNNILSIDNDMAAGILTLRLLYNPGKAGLEYQRYINTLLRELEEFKKQHGIDADCVNFMKDSFGNVLSIRINMPNPNLYDLFILHLARKSLLPTQNIKQTSKPHYPGAHNHFTPLNPLSMLLTPLDKKRQQELEEEERQRRFVRPRTPLDGLKRY